MFVSRMTRPASRISAGASEQGCRAPYAWLAAGALVVGGAIALAGGAGTAHADVTASTPDTAHSTAPATRSSGRNADHRPRAAATAADNTLTRTVDTTPERRPQHARVTSAVAPTATGGPVAPETTGGSASFSYTGAPQTWQVPAGVQTASVQAQGGFGGACVFASCNTYATPEWLYPANVNATITLTAPTITALNITVGGGGASTNSAAGGAGGYNGGGLGGLGGSTSVTSGSGGAGGGGATTVYVITGGAQASDPALVAGGGGGSGGQVFVGQPGGFGGSAVTSPGPGIVWPGNSGQTARGTDGGSGGAGGVIPQGIGQPGGDAEEFSNNGGGGGGGGGYLGGLGGAPGQADVISVNSGAGGGGGSGSSYASPQWTSNASAAAAPQPPPNTPVGQNGNATVQWVSILTTALAPLPLGLRSSQQLQAYYANSPAVTWQVSGGALPAGLTLSPAGVLAGTPSAAGPYSYQATVSSTQNPSVTSVMTYSGTVTAPTLRQVVDYLARWWRIPRPKG